MLFLFTILGNRELDRLFGQEVVPLLLVRIERLNILQFFEFFFIGFNRLAKIVEISSSGIKSGLAPAENVNKVIPMLH